jgi:2-polyprenyl-6-methoxyphenol hydroxylase-like FAD-dependent oxidoreductase
MAAARAMSVIIVGGGMTGATLALAISQLSHGTLPVHLIEASEPETDRHPGFDAARSLWRQEPASSWRDWRLAGDCRLRNGH